MVVIPKRRTGSIVAFFGKFPIHLYYINTTAHALFLRFHMFITPKLLSIPAGIATDYISKLLVFFLLPMFLKFRKAYVYEKMGSHYNV